MAVIAAPKIITPAENQDADAWKFGYRIYGIIRTYENNLFIQNITYTHSAYETGATISAGERITTTKPYGKVTVESGAKVVFDGDGDVVLEPGVVVKPGGRLEIR